MIKDKLDYYFKIATVISERSPDAETKVGAIAVHSESGAIKSTGYNGFIRGANDDNLPKHRPDKYDHIIHAEQNIITNCARHGIQMSDCFVIVTLSPCIQCLKLLWQSGVDIIYFRDEYKDFQYQLDNSALHIDVQTAWEYKCIRLSPKL